MLRTIGSIFTKKPKEARELTRFEKIPELNAFAPIFIKLTSKRDELKAIADKNGAQSVEYHMHTIVNHIVTNSQREIDAFNNAPEKQDPLDNLRDMHTLVKNIKDFIVISNDDMNVVNSSATDKPYVRNATIGVGLLLIPFTPFIALGATAVAALLFVGGLVMMGGTEKLLINLKAIDKDTETKHLIESFIEITGKIEANLQKHIDLLAGKTELAVKKA